MRAKTSRKTAKEESRKLRLKRQAEIRNLRGKLKWKGDLDAMRTDC